MPVVFWLISDCPTPSNKPNRQCARQPEPGGICRWHRKGFKRNYSMFLVLIHSSKILTQLQVPYSRY